VRLNKLDLNLLVALDAMLSEMSVTAAAGRLSMSQSAMSNALSRLREHFQDRLLVQVGRRMEITPRGEVLRDAVRDVLMRIDTSIATQPVFTAATSDREFRILVSDYSLMTYIPHVVELAQRESDSVRFRLLAQVEAPQRKLERGEADVLVFPRNYCLPEHPADRLWEEQFVCLAWNGSKHAGKPLSLQDYLDAGHISMQPSISVPSVESAYLTRAGVERRIDITTHNFLSVPALLVGGDRIATVHRRLAYMAQRIMPVSVLPMPLPLPVMEQCLQWHKYRTMDPGLIWLRELMQRAVRQMDERLLHQSDGEG
jgi:LysR family nod box-dependent transcriptional activator